MADSVSLVKSIPQKTGEKEISQTEAGEFVQIDTSGRTIDLFVAAAPQDLAPDSDIYETLFGIEYNKTVQELVGYHSPQQAWIALTSGKDILAGEEKDFVDRMPSLIGDAGKIAKYPLLYQDSLPIESYRARIRKALREPENPLRRLIVAYCCHRINTVKVRSFEPRGHSFGAE